MMSAASPLPRIFPNLVVHVVELIISQFDCKYTNKNRTNQTSARLFLHEHKSARALPACYRRDVRIRCFFILNSVRSVLIFRHSIPSLLVVCPKFGVPYPGGSWLCPSFRWCHPASGLVCPVSRTCRPDLVVVSLRFGVSFPPLPSVCPGFRAYHHFSGMVCPGFQADDCLRQMTRLISGSHRHHSRDMPCGRRAGRGDRESGPSGIGPSVPVPGDNSCQYDDISALSH